MWRKSSLSAVNNCLEADGPWVKAAACSAAGSCVEISYQSASKCESAACLEVADKKDGLIRIRDTKQWKEGGPEGPILVYPVSEWDEGRVVVFLKIERGEVPVGVLDLREDGDPEAQWHAVPGWTQAGEAATLWFDQDEVDAYKDGIKVGDFELAVV